MKSFSCVFLALLAFNTTNSAIAQSNISLYGRLDTSIEQQKFGSTTTSGLSSNGSFIGLRGQEDLGGGLKAGFVLEAQINTDTGNGTDYWGEDEPLNFKRRSEVNLAGSFGMLRLGNFRRASYEATAHAISWHNDNEGSTADSFADSKAQPNVIAYRSPSWRGMSAELQYSFGEKAVWVEDIKYQDGIDLGLRYDQGPWGLGFGYGDRKLKGTVYGDHLKDKTYSIRASYDNGNFALGAYYLRDETHDYWPGLEKFHAHSNVLRIATKYVLGSSEFHASIGRRNYSSSTEQLYGNTPDSTHSKSSRNEWLLAYHYNLSRRTKVYAFYGHQDDMAPIKSFPSLWTGNTDGNFRTMGLGVRHLF